MHYGVILLWFILTALSVAFVAIDIRTTPEATVMKWGFVLVTLFTGPFGAFLYVLGCREPLPGMHEAYVAALWRQALGSAMHCVAGDGIGILTGAVIAALLLLSPFADFLLEYVLGLLFGWGIFQALFMRAVIGGSYALSLRSTFIPELTSMNCLMAGMMVVTMIGKTNVPGGTNPSSPAFWFIMSMGLLVGLCATYPMNYWLVSRKLKHGMMTVRPKGATPATTVMPGSSGASGTTSMPAMESHGMDMTPDVASSTIAFVVVLSFVVLIIGVVIGMSFS